MKNLKLILIIMMAIIVIWSCESPIDNIPMEKLPQTESRLVVNSVISPQLPYINVIVSESIPLFSNSNASEGRLTNATVRISDGVNEMVIPYDKENNLYSLEQSKFPIKVSKTYILTVSDGKRTVKAQCKVPNKAADIKSYDFDTLLIYNPIHQDTAVTLRVSWQDVHADTNFYRINATMDFEFSTAIKEVEQKFVEHRNSVQERFNWNWQQGRNDYLSDNHLDGALLSSPMGKLHLPQTLDLISGDGKKVIFYPRTKIHSVLIEVYNVDKHYYKYERSLEIKNNSDSPFAEPSTIYSNVTGGLGCFSAYNASQVKVSFSK